jgi:hypothetical protein
MGSLDEWLKFSRWCRDMQEQGFAGVVEELLTGKYEPEDAESVVTARFFRQVFDELAEDDRSLGEFDLDAHEQLRERFRKLDEWEVRAAGSPIRQYQLGRDDRPRSGWFSEATSELGILQKETQKKRKQLPLRKLFAEIPGVLQRLKPCIMMSLSPYTTLFVTVRASRDSGSYEGEMSCAVSVADGCEGKPTGIRTRKQLVNCASTAGPKSGTRPGATWALCVSC